MEMVGYQYVFMKTSSGNKCLFPIPFLFVHVITQCTCNNNKTSKGCSTICFQSLPSKPSLEVILEV